MPSMTDSRAETAILSLPALIWVVLMNLWCYSLLFLWTLIGVAIFPVAFTVCLITLRWSADKVVRWFIWVYGRGWMLLMSPFVRFRRQQLEVVEPGKPYLLVVNHLSFFDTYCMALLPAYDITFAVRSWPFKMFWYSGFMRLARYLDVEGNSWEETLSNSNSAFASGGTVLFFQKGIVAVTDSYSGFIPVVLKLPLLLEFRLCLFVLMGPIVSCLQGVNG